MSTISGASIPAHASDVSCIELVNSSFSDHLDRRGTVDRLPLSEWREWFLVRYELMPTPVGTAPMGRLKQLRQDLRGILGRWARRGVLASPDAKTLDSWIAQAVLRQRVTAVPRGVDVRLEPQSPNWTWTLSRIAFSAVDLISHGDPRRLKVCSNPACSWMYYDTTLNASKRYCSTSPCANLVRVRRFREATRAGSPDR